jgi:hypothetical protein
MTNMNIHGTRAQVLSLVNQTAGVGIDLGTTLPAQVDKRDITSHVLQLAQTPRLSQKSDIGKQPTGVAVLDFISYNNGSDSDIEAIYDAAMRSLQLRAFAGGHEKRIIKFENRFPAISKVSQAVKQMNQGRPMKTLYFNSHIFDGDVTAVAYDGRKVHKVKDFAERLVQEGIVARGSDVIFTGCLKGWPTVEEQREFQDVANRYGVTLHIPTMPQDVGPLHGLIRYAPNRNPTMSPFNQRPLLPAERVLIYKRVLFGP